MARPKKYSPVFPPTVKPVHVGVYQRKTHYGWWVFAKWDGHDWKSWANYATHADKISKLTIHPNLKWRGLAEKP